MEHILSLVLHMKSLRVSISIQIIESPAEMDTLSDYIWRTSDQILSTDSSCARLASSYWDPEVEIWHRI